MMDSSSLPEVLMEKRILAATNLNCMTMRSSTEFICVRGYRLHARTFWPKDLKEVKGVVSFNHGYASHTSRPIHEHLAKRITNMGFVYLTHDMYGHGYSSGIRGYIPDSEILIESAVTMIYTVFDETFDNGRAYIQKPFTIAKTLPIFLIGHSMGGAVTIPAAKELQALGYNLAGCLFLAPMITLTKPPAWQKSLLLNLFARFFPETMNALGSRSASVVSDEYQRYCAFDGDPSNIHGIGYSQPIRYGTYATLLQLIAINEKLLAAVDFPFIIFHDTADVVVPYEGAQLLFTKSRTDPSKKELVTMDGGHDLLAKRLGVILAKMEDWLSNTLDGN